MKNWKIGVLIFLFVTGAVYTSLINKNKAKLDSSQVTDIASENQEREILGGDKDEYGCIPSAGYTWCEEKQKCLRVWEESCDNVVEMTAVAYDAEQISADIKKALVVKHGSEAENLNVTVSQVSDNFAKGMASEEGGGGGIWFGVNVNNTWTLVWDGNGIITCDVLEDYPDFPSVMIPECYDNTSDSMVKR